MRDKLGSLLDDADDAPHKPAPTEPNSGKKMGGRQIGMVAASVLILIFAGFMIARTLGGVDPGRATMFRTLIDSQTGEVFRDYRIDMDRNYPYRNPKTGTDTLYPVELCYWNADGTAKLEPTFVYVQAYAGETTETRCPDCGRRVVPHNPLPPDDLLLEAAERAKAGGK